MTRLPLTAARDDLECPKCGTAMVIRWTAKFSKTDELEPFYACPRFPACRATHGAHPDGSPLGTPACDRTKAARIVAHELFDRLWKGLPGSRKRARGRAYARLRYIMDMTQEEAHIAKFDFDQCVRLIVKLGPELLRHEAEKE